MAVAVPRWRRRAGVGHGGGPARHAATATGHLVQHVQTVADIIHKANKALDTSNLIRCR
jgi:hypothetical protein